MRRLLATGESGGPMRGPAGPGTQECVRRGQRQGSRGLTPQAGPKSYKGRGARQTVAVFRGRPDSGTGRKENHEDHVHRQAG
ncbi:hypothetical protein SBA4_2870007 [Candidatus Sulfopaludibacter sp. SbA4]|nr:hypothetical protein SBA4_2870007 [Candidatus Sulfopaludibacter sp. SbA4]